jgi:hypothetical protein
VPVGAGNIDGSVSDGEIRVKLLVVPPLTFEFGYCEIIAQSFASKLNGISSAIHSGNVGSKLRAIWVALAYNGYILS